MMARNGKRPPEGPFLRQLSSDVAAGGMTRLLAPCVCGRETAVVAAAGTHSRARKVAHQLTLLVRDISVLPIVISLQKTNPPLFTLSLEFGLDRAESVVIVYVEDMYRVGFCKRAVAADDQHIFIIRIGSLETEVVASKDNVAIVETRVNNDQLVMNNGADTSARRELLDTEITKKIPVINS